GTILEPVGDEQALEDVQRSIWRASVVTGEILNTYLCLVEVVRKGLCEGGGTHHHHVAVRQLGLRKDGGRPGGVSKWLRNRSGVIRYGEGGQPRGQIGDGVGKVVLDEDDLARRDMSDRAAMAIQEHGGRADEHLAIVSTCRAGLCLVEEHAVRGRECTSDRLVRGEIAHGSKLGDDHLPR